MTEYRAVAGDIRVSAMGGQYTEIRGRACPYNVKTDVGPYYEIMMPGCFAKSIQQSPRPLPLLLFHETGKTDHIVGHATRWDERPDGLYGTWDIDPSADAQEAARRAERGDLTGLSVRFVPVRDDRIGSDTVVRHECRLIEVSLTSTPAYKEGVVTSVRSERGPRRDTAASTRRPRPNAPAVEPVQQAREHALRDIKSDGVRIIVNAKIGSWLRQGGLAYARMMAGDTCERGDFDFVTVTIDPEDSKARNDARIEARRALYDLSRAALPRRRRRRIRTSGRTQTAH